MTNVCFHLQELPRIGKFIETEGKIEITEGWEEGEMSYILMNTKFLYNEKVLEMNSDSCTVLWVYLMPLNCTFKTG